MDGRTEGRRNVRRTDKKGYKVACALLKQGRIQDTPPPPSRGRVGRGGIAKKKKNTKQKPNRKKNPHFEKVTDGRMEVPTITEKLT